MPFFFIFLFVFLSPIWTQEVLTSNVASDTSQEYRPGLNFQTVGLDTHASLANLLGSANISTELTEVGRAGAIKTAETTPILGIDGFVIKDPSIQNGQMKLELLPYDFACRVDLYKQNLVPFGVNAGSFIDFRIPITRSRYTSILAKASTDANVYSKIQSEQPFQDGSTFFGVVLDYGFKDYNYATDDGSAQYYDSKYKRTSLISKTTWKDLDFLLSHTYVEGANEPGLEDTTTCLLEKNSLITGVRYNKGIFTASANYTFYNMYVEGDEYICEWDEAWSSPAYTNDYHIHQLNAQFGVRDKIDIYTYSVIAGYEFNYTHDGNRATSSNYTDVPQHGEHFLNLASEFGVILVENAQLRFDLDLALNQIIYTTGKYVPVPNLSLGLRHQSGFYSSAYVSRVYVNPDLTSLYGAWGVSPDLQAKDGVRTGLEFGINKSLYRFYANASYSWLEKDFRLNGIVLENADAVHVISTEIGTEYNHIIGDDLKHSLHTAVAWNRSEDQNGVATSTMPMYKWIKSYSISDMNETWKVRLSYQLVTKVPDTSGNVDNTVRHYVDLHLSYDMFFINILNLANQSYRTIPFNDYSPYNSGIKAEFGIQYKFE